MSIPTFSPLVAKIFGKLPLRSVLIIPFVLQIVGTVGLVGYLSYKNGQNAVNDLSSNLQTRIASRVEQYLNTYLSTPHLINRINADAVAQGILDLQNLPKLERYLFWQMKQFDSVTTIIFGSKRGDFIGADRFTGKDLLMISERSVLVRWNYQLCKRC